MTRKTKAPTVNTTWELRTYDVWGNPRDGYEVNDSFSHGKIALDLVVETHNIGTDREFTSAYPTDGQLRAAFGVRCRLDVNGDDIHITVDRERDNYPIGELYCTSHDSLSPIRAMAPEGWQSVDTSTN